MFELYKSEHKQEVIDLIDEIYREYNEELCLTGCDSDLYNIDKNYKEKGGTFWVYKNNKGVIATVAVKKVDDNAELKRFYLDKNFRGSGIADELLKKAESWSIEKKFNTMFFWSDTRFTRAHRYYEKRGYKKGNIRKMNDGNLPYEEYYFEKQL